MLRKSILLSVSALAFAGAAAAQQAGTPPAQTPPTAEPIEKRDTPALPEREPKPRTTIRERKQGGEVQEAEVTSGGSTYTLRPDKRTGNAQPGSVDAGPSRAPTWSVLDFNLGQKKKKAGEDEQSGQEGQAEAPPPPPMPKSAPVKK